MKEISPEIELLRARVKECQGRYHVLAKASGMSMSWISKFANGHYESPRWWTVQRVAAALKTMMDEAA